MQTNDFITKLVKAANSIEKVGVVEQQILLQSSVKLIYELRASVGIPRNDRVRDALTDLKILAVKVDELSLAPDEIRDGFLQAAGMIRDLHIVKESGMEFLYRPRA